MHEASRPAVARGAPPISEDRPRGRGRRARRPGAGAAGPGAAADRPRKRSTAPRRSSASTSPTPKQQQALAGVNTQPRQLRTAAQGRRSRSTPNRRSRSGPICPAGSRSRARRPTRSSRSRLQPPAAPLVDRGSGVPAGDRAGAAGAAARRLVDRADADVSRRGSRSTAPTLNCVVTLTEELALAQAAQADKEIKAGRYRGPLHGIPWGAKDLFATKGIPTTWGAAPYQNQVIDYDATVVERLRDAGAVLVAKLSLGALAQGDRWFRGQTQEPVEPGARGSSGSSAGPGSATAAGPGRLRDRHRDARLDHLAVGRERRRRPASDLRPRQPLRRDGAQLDDGQDRPDVPLGRGLRAGVQRDLRAGRPRRHRRRCAVRRGIPTCRCRSCGSATSRPSSRRSRRGRGAWRRGGDAAWRRARPRRADAGTAARADRSAAEDPERRAGRLSKGGRDAAADRAARARHREHDRLHPERRGRGGVRRPDAQQGHRRSRRSTPGRTRSAPTASCRRSNTSARSGRARC